VAAAFGSHWLEGWHKLEPALLDIFDINPGVFVNNQLGKAAILAAYDDAILTLEVALLTISSDGVTVSGSGETVGETSRGETVSGETADDNEERVLERVIARVLERLEDRVLGRSGVEFP
jgi:hypothetical protein